MRNEICVLLGFTQCSVVVNDVSEQLVCPIFNGQQSEKTV
jgi:hypothetical protein